VATVHRKETIIALRARSKAFRVAMDFLHPQHMDVRPNVARCPCGGELKIVDADAGIWECMECRKQYGAAKTVLDEPEYIVPTHSTVKRVIAWVLLGVILLGTLAIALSAMNASQPSPYSPSSTVNPRP